LNGTTIDRPYLIKYNSNGQVLWAVNMTTTQIESVALSVAVDRFDNVYITGRYFTLVPIQLQNAVLNPPVGGPSFTLSPVTLPPTLSNTYAIFVTKYTSNGQVVWTTAFDGTADSDSGNGIAIDSNNKIYVSGSFNSTNNIQLLNGLSSFPYQSPSSKVLEGTNGVDTTFLIKIDEDGRILWATKFFSITSFGNRNSGIVCDNCDNIIISGFYAESVGSRLFLGNATTTSQTQSLINLPGSGLGCGYIAKYNTDGQALWASYIGSVDGTATGRGTGVTIDYINNIYLTGNYFSSQLFNIFEVSGNGQIITNYTLPITPVSGSMYIIKYTNDGRVIWGTYLQNNLGTDTVSGRAISIDGLNNIYVSGQYTGPATLQNVSVTGQSSSSITLPAFLNPFPLAAYVVKYNENGQAVWAAYLDSDNFNDISFAVHIDPLTNFVYIGGQDKSSVTGSIGLDNASSLGYSTSGISLAAGSQQGFLVKYV
jgi:hypothetical protein